MHSPGFSKRAHGYGTPFPEPAEADALWQGRYFLEDSSLSCPESSLLAWGEHLLSEEENWAGAGFETPYEET